MPGYYPGTFFDFQKLPLQGVWGLPPGFVLINQTIG
jgi:hypothetical protein